MTYSADHLRNLADKIKKEQMLQFIESEITPNVLNAAKKRETSYFWFSETQALRDHHLKSPEIYENRKQKWFEDVLIAAKEKFPGTRIETQENWVELPSCNGLKVKTRGILIDWS